MATRPYFLGPFGSSAISGLAPTFTKFFSTAGSTLAPPAITEISTIGIYLFNHDPITAVAFVCDGATSGLQFSDRYIYGSIDPFDQFGVTLNAIGNTAIQGITLNYSQGQSLLQAITLGYGVGLSNIALGNTAVLGITLVYSQGLSAGAVGATLLSQLGNTASSFGTDVLDPTTVFGFLKRALETREGDETYTKADGTLDIYARGATQLLREKFIDDTSTETTKT